MTTDERDVATADRIARAAMNLCGVAVSQVDAGNWGMDKYDEAKAEVTKIIASAISAAREEGEKANAERIAWMREAMLETLKAAQQGHMDENTIGSLSFAHIKEMPARSAADFSAAKLGRWLGWMQAAVVASGAATLDDMKAINKRCSEAIRSRQAQTGETK